MPTRCVKLKLIIPRDADRQALRSSIWATHFEMNAAIAAIEGILLRCRGAAYIGEDGAVSDQDAQTASIIFAREVQRCNGKHGVGTDAEVLAALRELYTHLAKGNAQAVRGWAGPLMNAKSKGGMECLKRIVDPLPAWVDAMNDQRAGWEAESERWLETVRGTQVWSGKSRWVKKQQAGEAWHADFIKDQQKQRAKAGEDAALIRSLRDELGLLPIMKAPFGSRITGARGALTPWDYTALRLAKEHLISWETWNVNLAKSYADLCKKLSEQSQLVEERYALASGLVRNYEQQRHETLKRVTLATDDRPYTLGSRAIREWRRVYEAWLSCATEADRIDAVNGLQSRLRGRFGDPDFFKWLARSDNLAAWQDPDAILHVVRLNGLQRGLARKRRSALWTPAEARLHPRWMLYEYNSTNTPRYRVEHVNGKLVLRVPLLQAVGEKLMAHDGEFELAPSGQAQDLKWEPNKVSYWSAHQRMSATPGSSNLLLGRRWLEGHPVGRLSEGEIGPVWIKLALNVQAQAPEGWTNARGEPQLPAAGKLLLKALPADVVAVAEPPIAAGLRVLSADLGLRDFAACSVFELVDRRPEKGLYFRAGCAQELWARHERSFLLRLPGETPSPQQQTARMVADDELRTIRSHVRAARELIRLTLDGVPRKETIEGWLNSAHGRTPAILDLIGVDDVEALLENASESQGAWAARVTVQHRRAMKRLSQIISEWRCRTRPRSGDGTRGYAGGKSAWVVDHLTRIRKLLMSWSWQGRAPDPAGKRRRSDDTFARKLLKHINHLKDDRVKTGADLLVQSARGYVQLPSGGWSHKYAPCQLIILEDLARYNFRTDRSRRENSQLMQWCHRQIKSTCEMQAKLYGITVETAGAGFSSRFHAKTAAPGVRCTRVSAGALSNPVFQAVLLQELEGTGIDPAVVSDGDVVPWAGGELFATVDQFGKAVVTHADINAAQNLQRRFWTRYSDLYRISCSQGAGGTHLVQSGGKRIAGALQTLVAGSGPCGLEPGGDGAMRLGRTSGRNNGRRDDEEDAEELELIRGEQRYFRDPSGLLLPADRWYASRTFWGEVRRRVSDALANELQAAQVFREPEARKST